MFKPKAWSKSPWTRMHKPRSRRWWRTLAVLLNVLIAHRLLSSVLAHRRGLREKFTATTYNHITRHDEDNLANIRWNWKLSVKNTQQAAYSREDLWMSRREWKWLASGAEGDAYTYNGTVIKVYKGTSFPPRNCVPDVYPELRWPTEISASILLGGMAESQMEEDAGFLPVTDYFLSPATDEDHPAWHFVTPLMPSGSLKKLAGHLRTQKHPYTARELDFIFRPSIEKLMQTLAQMHTQFDLCHDDIKLDNIFLASPSSLDEIGEDLDRARHWILADLGNVRESSHPYHSSILWTVLSNNLPDCRANDVIRLLKSYMMFLGASVDDVTAFNEQFLEGRESWSRLFWKFWDDVQSGKSISAEAVGSFSIHNDPSSFEMGCMASERDALGLSSPLYRLSLSREGTMAKAVTNVLDMNTSDMMARIWGLVYLFGVPVGRCDGEFCA